MDIETFELERYQSLWENEVEYNLTESGIHPFTLRELLDAEQIEDLLDLRLGYGQTNGAKTLRDAISRDYPGTDRDHVIVTNGSAEANFIAIWSMLDPGDELILTLPNYMQIWGIARAFGVTVKPLHLREDDHWRVDLDDLDALITPRTRMIAVCNPNNPTGAILDAAQMRAFADRASAHDLWIYSDEVYRGAELEGEMGPSFMALYPKTVVAAGLSKALSHPGLRIGWLVGPKDVIAKAWHHRDYTTIASTVLSQQLAEIILEPSMRDKIFQRNRALLKTNLDLIGRWVAGHGGRLSFIPPRAGGFAFIRYRMDIGSTELATRLRDEKSVLIIPGDFFGMPGYIRIGIGSETDTLQEGLKRIDAFFAEIN